MNFEKSHKRILKNPLLWIVIAFNVFVMLHWIFTDINIKIMSDDLGGMAVTSLLAGYDWRDVLKETGYYGYGIRWMWFILLKWTTSPEMFILGIKIFYVCLFTGVGTWLFIVLNKKYGDKFSFVAEMVFLIFACKEKNVFRSEQSIFLGMTILCIVTLIAINNNNEKLRKFYSVLISFLLCYNITLHERSVILIFAFLLMLLITYIYNKKTFVNIWYFLISLALFYFLEELLTENIINYFWPKGTKNTGISMSKAGWLWPLQSFDNLCLFAEGLLTNFVCLVNKTYGMFIFVFAFAIEGMVDFFSVNKKYRQYFNKYEGELSVIIFSFISTIGMIIGVVLQWGGKITYGKYTGYKGFFYTRYYLVFAYIGIVFTVLLFSQMQKQNTMMYVGIILLMGIAERFLLVRIPYYEKIEETLSQGRGYYRIAENVGNFTDIFSDYNKNIFLSYAIICIGFGVWIIYSKEKRYLLTFLIALVIFIAFSDKSNWGRLHIPKFYSSHLKVIEKIRIADSKGVLPDTIYVEDATYSNIYFFQFMLKDKKIVISVPELKEDMVAITYQNSSDWSTKLLEEDLNVIQYSDEWCVWTNNEDIFNVLKESNY